EERPGSGKDNPSHRRRRGGIVATVEPRPKDDRQRFSARISDRSDAKGPSPRQRRRQRIRLADPRRGALASTFHQRSGRGSWARWNAGVVSRVESTRVGVSCRECATEITEGTEAEKKMMK